MSDKLDEKVLCVPAARFKVITTSWRNSSPLPVPWLLAPEETDFVRRRICEGNPAWKQIIPYVVFRTEEEVFTYTRGSSGGEGRLHALRSLGVGGHVSEDDMAGASGIQGLMAAMKREIDEEVVMPTLPWKVEILGLIHEAESPNPVDRDHVGVLVVAHLHWPDVRAREDCLADARWEKIARAKQEILAFENWSAIFLKKCL